MRRLGKILLIVVSLIGVLMLSAHLILTYRAKAIIKNLVVDLSNGKYAADLTEVNFSYFPTGIAIKNLSLKPTHNNDKLASLNCDFINLKVRSVYDIIFNKTLDVKLLSIYRPSIVAYAKQKSGSQKKGVAEAMKEIQHSLLKTFKELDVEDVLISDAAVKIFTANDDGTYFSINHITIDLKNIEFEKQQEDLAPIFNVQGEITFNKPDIHFADTSILATLGYLKASSNTHDLVLDSIHFTHLQAGLPPTDVRFSRVAIKHFNWDRYLNEGLFELDSVMVDKGDAVLSFAGTNNPEHTSNSSHSKTYAGITFIIHHASVSNISYQLQTKDIITKKNAQMQLRLNGDSFILKELSIVNGRKPAVDVQELNLRITNFSESDEDNSYTFSLGDLAITNKTLILKDYLLKANRGSKFGLDNKIVIPELKLEDYSMEDLLQKKLIASSITVTDPEVVLDILAKDSAKAGKKKDINKIIQQTMESLAGKLDIGEVAIHNASIRMLPQANPKDEIKIAGLSLLVNGKTAIKATSVMDIIHSIKTFSTTGFTLSSGNINLKVNDLKLLTNPRGLYFGSVQGQFGEGTYVDLKGVTLLNANNTLDLTSADGLHASDFIVESGSITINKRKKNAIEAKSKKALPAINADHIDIKNFTLKLEDEGKLAVSTAFDLEALDFLLQGNHANWSKLTIGSSDNRIVSGTTTFKAGSMQLKQPGTIEILNASGSLVKDYTDIQFNTEKLQIGVGISSTNMPEVKVKSILMENPSLVFSLKKKSQELKAQPKTAKPFSKPVTLERFELNNPTITVKITDNTGKEVHNSQFIAGQLACNDFQLYNIDQQPQISIGSARYFSSNAKTFIAEKLFNPSYLQVNLRDIKLSLQSKSYSFLVDTMQLKNIANTIYGKNNDTISLSVNELGILNFPFASTDSFNWKKMLITHRWWTKGGNISYNTPAQKISVLGLQAKRTDHISFGLDSFHMAPRATREEFWKAEPFEKDHMSLSMGKTFSNHLKVDFSGKKPAFAMVSLVINNLHLVPQRDKTRPEDTVSYRPLLAQQITNIPMPIKIDTVTLNNGRVGYHEIAQKSGKEGHLFLDQINGTIVNVKNHDFTEKDSLLIAMRTRLYGKGAMRLGFRQSYTDTLQGFWMRVRMGQFNMKEMNALLLPLMGLRINSGIVDTLTLIVNGNDKFAYGTMDLRYHNMSVRLLGEGGKEKYFMANTINWLINQILRRNDNGRPNVVFKERVMKRGQFNFWGKIAVEGLLTNIGVKSDNKEERNFKKNIRQYKLPENYWSED